MGIAVHRGCAAQALGGPSVLPCRLPPTWEIGKVAAIAQIPQRASRVESERAVSKVCLPTRTLDISIDSGNCRRTCGWDERGVSRVTDGASGRAGPTRCLPK